MSPHRSINFYLILYAISLIMILVVHYLLVLSEMRHHEQLESIRLFEEIQQESLAYAESPDNLTVATIVHHHPALARRNYQIILTDPKGNNHINIHTAENSLRNIIEDTPFFGLPNTNHDYYIQQDKFGYYIDRDKLAGWIKFPEGYEASFTLMHVPVSLDLSSARVWVPFIAVILLVFIAFSNFISRLHLWHIAIDYANQMSKPSDKAHKYNTYEPIDYGQEFVGQEFARLGHAMSRANYRLHYRKRKIDTLMSRIDRLISHAPLPIAFIQRTGKISFINERFAYLFKVSLQNSSTLYLTDFITAESDVEEKILANLSEEKISRTLQVTDKQNNHTYQLHLMPWFAAHGQLQGFTVMINNISQVSNKLEETLAQMNQQSARLDDFDKLWSVMGHELRTPLSGIIGMLELMKDSNLNKEQKETFQTLKQTSQSMLFMLNDMLDLAKLDAGKLQLSLEKTDILQMCRQICELMVANARQQNIDFLFCYNPRAPRYIQTDEARLRQVLLNLIGNAIKFTQSGFVALRISVLHQFNKLENSERQLGKIHFDDDIMDGFNPYAEYSELNHEGNDKTYLRFEVIDTGIGISKEEQSKLFSFFNQANNDISKTFGGTGLGLAISKNFTEMLGGEILLQSQPNVGSNFEVIIPIQGDYDQTAYQFSGDFSHICLVGLMRLQAKAEYIQVLCDYLGISNIIETDINADIVESINQQLEQPKTSKLKKVFIIDHALIQRHNKNKGNKDILPTELNNITNFDNMAKLLLSMTPERNIPNALLDEFNGYLSNPMDVSFLVSELVRLTQDGDESSLRVSKLQHNFNTFLQSLDEYNDIQINDLDKDTPFDLNNTDHTPINGHINNGNDDSLEKYENHSQETNITNGEKPNHGSEQNNKKLVPQTITRPLLQQQRPLILVAEDNNVNQKVAVKTLEKLGYDAITANDGQQALNILETRRSEICMILMDCRMPVMDGFEATRAIRKGEDSIPIIALTANNTDEDKQACLHAGMDNFLPKPIQKDTLQQIMKKYGI